jgi:hypothetical protein
MPPVSLCTMVKTQECDGMGCRVSPFWMDGKMCGASCIGRSAITHTIRVVDSRKLPVKFESSIDRDEALPSSWNRRRTVRYHVQL